MIWLLLLFTVSSAFGVLESLLELVGVLLVVLHNAVEDLAGRQAAAMIMVIVVGAGVAYGVWYFKASPDDRPPPQVDVARYTPLAREQPRPTERPRTDRSNVSRFRTACGNGAAPLGLELAEWRQYRCEVPDSDACLGWSAYAQRPERGCPRAQLCCPPVPSATTE